MRYVLAAVTLLACIAVHPTSAHASDAETLFNEGKTLLAQGRAEEACVKLAESEKLEHGLGVRFYLAMCREQTGRYASAWAGYLAVASEASARGQDAREKVARDYAAKVEPKVARARVEVNDTSPDLVVLRNGVVIERDEYGQPIPIDPGTYTFEARAPGHQPWKHVIEVTMDSRLYTVSVPPLEKSSDGKDGEGATKAAENEPSRTADDGSSRAIRRTAAGAAAVVGVVALGVGGYFGIRALDKYNESSPHCRGDQCDAIGVGIRADAVSDGTASTIAMVAGAGLLATAGILWLLTPSQEPSRRGRIDVIPGAGRIALRGSF
jgi:hypothetical protein